MELLDSILEFVSAQPVWVGLIILGLCALIEYLFPPFPGDTVTIAGAVLIPTAGYPWWGVLGAVMAGSVMGAATNWGLGDWIARTPHRSSPFHRLISSEKFAPTIDKIKAKFQERGVIYIAVNRFVPAFRSLIFLSAGLAGVRLGPVLIWSSVSAAAWNLALMGVGYGVGYRLDDLTAIVETYMMVVLGFIFLVVAWRYRHMLIRKDA